MKNQDENKKVAENKKARKTRRQKPSRKRWIRFEEILSVPRGQKVKLGSSGAA